MTSNSPLYYSHPVGNSGTSTNLQLQQLINNLSINRQEFFNKFFDSRRDLDAECGYPQTGSNGITGADPDAYRELYDRMPIARRVVELMPKECWQVQPKIWESEDPDDVTEFEAAWDNLGKTVRAETSWHGDESGSAIWEYLKRADIMSGIGRFGILLLGIDDGLNLDQPVEGVVTLNPTGNACPSTPTVNTGAFTKKAQGQDQPEIDKEGIANEERLLAQNRKEYDALVTSHNQTLAGNYSSQQVSGSGYDYGAFSDSGTPGGAASLFKGSAEMYAGVQGTDAQYVGVQLSPPEFPKKEPSGKKRNLLFLRVFDESLVQIVQYEADLRNPRFGKPVMYRITLNDPREQSSGIGLPIATVRVHWSRVIHLADNLQSSEIFGAPRVRPVLNNIMDLRKIYGASAEGYWKSCFGGLQFKTNPQIDSSAQVDIGALRGAVENYQNSLQKYLLAVGGEWGTLAPTVVDPTPHIQVQLTAICIVLGCPMRVFMGSERGELSSGQDDVTWNIRRVPERQSNYDTPRVIVPFIDRCIQIGILPAPKAKATTSSTSDDEIDSPETPIANAAANSWASLPPGIYHRTRIGRKWVWNAEGKRVIGKGEITDTLVKTSGGYTVEWPDLDSLTAKDKAAIMLQRTQAYQAYVMGNLETVIPPHEYMTGFDSMTDEEAAAVLEAASAAHEDEETMTGPPMVGGRSKAPEEGQEGYVPPEEEGAVDE